MQTIKLALLSTVHATVPTGGWVTDIWEPGELDLDGLTWEQIMNQTLCLDIIYEL